MTDTHGRPIYSDTRKAYAVDLYEVGASVGQVAGAMGVPQSTVARWVRNAGVMRIKQATADRMAARELEERTGIACPDDALTPGPVPKPDAMMHVALRSRAALRHFIPFGEGGPFWGAPRRRAA